MSIYGFALGTILLQSMAALPASHVLIVLPILIAITLLLCRAYTTHLNTWLQRALVFALALACGFAWSALRAEWRLADALPITSELRDITLVGVVDGLPQQLDGGAVRFVMQVESASAEVPVRVQLSWYGWRSQVVPQLRPGERWQLVVRLKRPHGFFNPHGFDYEAWLLERGIRATGYVRANDANQRLLEFVPGFMTFVHRLREQVRERFVVTLPQAPYVGILVALAVGDQRGIPQQDWNTFRRTAVGHLVAISGLHVSLVALFAGGLAGFVWRRIPPLVLRMPARRVAACAGLIAAAVYALLAGLGLPAQRALLMLAVAALAMMLGREIRPGRVLAMALAVVLVADPWAVLSAGFWLSFGAVGVILLVLSGRMQVPTGLRAAIRIQLAISLALTPALLALFNAFSLVGPLANAFAIPLVSFVIAPLVLLSIVIPAAWLLEIAHFVTRWMMVWLEWLAAFPVALWQTPSLPPLLIVAGVVAVAWLLLPRPLPGRTAACLALVPVLFWTPARPSPGEFHATVLDVGQGLAVHVQTATHDLLYDAGPPYGPTANAGERVIVPYLRATGIARLDAVVLSHGDSDHIGGAVSVFESLGTLAIWSGLPDDHAVLASAPVRGGACSAGVEWEWDGVSFAFLHPLAEGVRFSARNEASCVLRVVSEGGAMLIPGDIGATSERSLVGSSISGLASDVVVTPHHGSRSSSSPAFVKAVDARHSIHSVGNLNRYRHPHPDVWTRWERSGARNWRTDGHGAIRVRARREGVDVFAWRERAPRYWHGR